MSGIITEINYGAKIPTAIVERNKVPIATFIGKDCEQHAELFIIALKRFEKWEDETRKNYYCNACGAMLEEECACSENED